MCSRNGGQGRYSCDCNTEPKHSTVVTRLQAGGSFREVPDPVWPVCVSVLPAVCENAEVQFLADCNVHEEFYHDQRDCWVLLYLAVQLKDLISELFHFPRCRDAEWKLKTDIGHLMPIKGPSRETSNEQQTACWQGRVCGCMDLSSWDASDLPSLGAWRSGIEYNFLLRPEYTYIFSSTAGSWAFARTGCRGRAGRGLSWSVGSQFPGKSMPSPQAPVFSSKSPGWRMLVRSRFLNWVLITQMCTVCENPSNLTLACSHFSVCRLHFQKQLKEKNLAGEHKDPRYQIAFSIQYQ